MVRLDSGDASFVVQQLAENPYTIEGRIAGVNLRFRSRRAVYSHGSNSGFRMVDSLVILPLVGQPQPHSLHS